jgi:hypothetical protein
VVINTSSFSVLYIWYSDKKPNQTQNHSIKKIVWD